jgi:hypothetical protein
VARDPRSIDEHSPASSPPALSAMALALLDAERLAPGPGADAMARVASKLAQSTVAPVASHVAAHSGWKLGLASSAVIAAVWAGVAAFDGPSAAPGATRATGTESVARAPAAAPADVQPPETSRPRAPEVVVVPLPTEAAQVVSPPLEAAQVMLRRDEADHTAPASRRPITEAAFAEPPAPKPVVAERAVPPEGVLVLAARDALLKARDPKAALAKLSDAARMYPRGLLREERDRLKFQAYSAAGRTADARRAASQFLARYPGSVHRTAAEAILGQ